MFDFISCVRDTGVEITLLPPRAGVLICIQVRELEHNYCERREITDDEAKSCGNIDAYTGQVIDEMIARIGRKKAKEYADRHKAHKREELEQFWKHSTPILTEESK